MIEGRAAFDEQMEQVNEIKFDNDYYKLII